jgi:hypothetical protein
LSKAQVLSSVTFPLSVERSLKIDARLSIFCKDNSRSSDWLQWGPRLSAETWSEQVSATETLQGDRQRKQRRDEERKCKLEQRRQRVAESRQRALAAVKTAGLRRILRLYEVEAVTGKK